jgi:hypothetical protein
MLQSLHSNPALIASVKQLGRRMQLQLQRHSSRCCLLLLVLLQCRQLLLQLLLALLQLLVPAGSRRKRWSLAAA